MQHLVICFENQAESNLEPRRRKREKHFMLRLQFGYGGSYFLMQSAQAVGGHGDDDDAQNDAKPEHSAGRTLRADGSQLTRSVIVTPNSPQFVLH